jgi:hypothetical protein
MDAELDQTDLRYLIRIIEGEEEGLSILRHRHLKPRPEAEKSCARLKVWIRSFQTKGTEDAS